MISYLIGIFVCVLLLYVSMIYVSQALFMLTMALTILMVISFLYLFFLRRQIDAKLAIPITVLDQGMPVKGTIHITSSGRLPLCRTAAQIRYGKRGDKKRRRSKRVEDSTFSFVLPTVGCYDFELQKVKLMDPFGLFSLTKRLKGGEVVLILPTLKTLPLRLGEAVHHFYGDADVYDELRPGYDPTENFDIREFRDGDRLENIHWKLSAKMDDLVIREKSLPKACPVVLFLKGAIPEEYAALSFSLLDQECPHYVCWMSLAEGDIIRARVDDEESFYNVLTTYMRDDDAASSTDLQEEYKRKYRGEYYLRDFVLRSDTRFPEEEEIAI